MGDRRKRYPKNLKLKVVKLHKEEGWTYADITQEYGVSKATITKWCGDLYKEILAQREKEERERKIAEMQSGASVEMSKLVAENEALRKENIFLKQAASYFAKESGAMV